MAATATRALDLIARAGVPHRVLEYEPADRHGRDRERRPDYGSDAAAALGMDRRLVHKTLAAAVDGRLVLAVVPVASELDLKRHAETVHGRRAVMASPADAERATGYVIGGISPLGTRQPLSVVVDADALELDSVVVSAGRRGLQVELAPADLVRLANAKVASIARGAGRGVT
ncbi:MAG TPA: aminoacyl-tRNA deacylase [Candidatus Limnocylindrales bacterium]